VRWFEVVLDDPVWFALRATFAPPPDTCGDASGHRLTLLPAAVNFASKRWRQCSRIELILAPRRGRDRATE
jgi:hypothetical protein